eukprot:PhF_6_TR37850/c0_g2_i1/m.56365
MSSSKPGKNVPEQKLPTTCILIGYELQPAGLVKTCNQHVLTKNELHDIIRDVNSIQGKALAVADLRLTTTLNTSNYRKSLVPHFFFSIAVVAMLNMPKALADALPHNSVFMKRKKMAYVSTQLKELYARKYRLFLCLTNFRFLALVGHVVVFTGFAMYFARQDYLKEADDHDDVTKESLAYRNHTETILKNLWAIYYHHPAYASIQVENRTPTDVNVAVDRSTLFT